MNPRSILTTVLLALTACLCLPLHADPAAEKQKPAPFPMQHFVGKWTDEMTQLKPVPKEPTISTSTGKLLDDGKRLVLEYDKLIYNVLTQDPKTGLVTCQLYSDKKLYDTMQGHWNPEKKQLTLSTNYEDNTQGICTITLSKDGRIHTLTQLKDDAGTILYELGTTSTKKE